MTISADSPEARSRRLSRALDLEGEDFLPLRAMVEAAGRLARAATDTGSLERAERVWRALDLLAPEDPVPYLEADPRRLLRRRVQRSRGTPGIDPAREPDNEDRHRRLWNHG